MTLNDNRIQLCTREEGHIQNESEMREKCILLKQKIKENKSS
jgi:hypothetical protein